MDSSKHEGFKRAKRSNEAVKRLERVKHRVYSCNLSESIE